MTRWDTFADLCGYLRAGLLREPLLTEVVYERHIHGGNLGFSAEAAGAYFAVLRRQVRRLLGGGP